ncbi:hypothetical protein ACA910_005050 [Epithemia clementina (nom. ined.)]
MDRSKSNEDDDHLSTESTREVLDEAEIQKRLQILRNFVRRTKVRNHYQQQQQCEEPNQLGDVPLFTEFLKVDYDKEACPANSSLGGPDAGLESGAGVLLGDDHDDDAQANVAPRQMIIDVDVELGLKPRTATAGKASSNSTNPESVAGNSSNMQPSMEQKLLSKTNKQSTAAAAAAFLSPKEEGYYEGCLPMTMAEDKLYLTDLQCWVRQNLELFSATAQDVFHSAYGGRRSSVVRGKIGVRCIHCANAAAKLAEDKLVTTQDGPESSTSTEFSTTIPSSMNRFHWPTAALSYPFNMNGLYSACTQKPHLHFNHCPYLPEEEKAQLKLLTDDTTDRPSKRVRGGVPGAMYYTIAAKRIGLIEIGDGMRFGRDLSLDPLPFETILAQVQDEKRENVSAATSTELVAQPVLSASAATMAPTQMTHLVGDEASEQVLAEAIAEPDDPSKLLARSGDKSLVSDFIFLTIRQMAICHAVPVDFATRGKKTKLMRVGFAGFCCRHCSSLEGVTTADYTCRSFCSAPDNLSSAISNSFSSHLSKCPRVPPRIKKALVAYRRIHQRQMSQVPYGSQRRLFHELWTRLRAADKAEAEMEKILSTMKPPPTAAEPDKLPYDVSSPDRVGSVSSSTPAVAPLPPFPSEIPSSATPDVIERGAEFPISSHRETVSMIQKHADNWDPKTNDNLIVPEDRNLVSDYVFLTMRQLKATLPTSSDSVRIRRGVPINPTVPGVCCIHCAEQPIAVVPSGRSFPSAPDNFASALNTSLYNHMQACPFIHDDLKRALADVRKLHSAQCAAIKFGSQRRYFNRLFDRLQRFQQVKGEGPSPRSALVDLASEVADAGFLQLPDRTTGCLFVCRRCNMVPIQFRSPGSFYSERPSVALARDHKSRCAGGRLDLRLAAETIRAAASSLKIDPVALISSGAFQAVLRHVIGIGNELFDVLSQGILAILENGNKAPTCTERADLWRKFSSAPIDVVDVKKAFGEFTSGLGYDSANIEDYPEIAAFLLMVAPSVEIN